MNPPLDPKIRTCFLCPISVDDDQWPVPRWMSGGRELAIMKLSWRTFVLITHALVTWGQQCVQDGINICQWEDHDGMLDNLRRLEREYPG